MGGDYRRPIENFDVPVNTRPAIYHGGLFDFAIDAPFYIEAGIDPRNGQPVGTPREFRAQEVGVFVQDDWKVNPRLTLNLGLRWDYFAPPTEAGNKLSFIGDPNRFNGDLLGWANPLGKHEEPGCIPPGEAIDEGVCILDRIHQSFEGFNLRQNRITSNYHGFNVQLAKRMAQGLSFQMAYTLGRSLDYNSDVFGYGDNGGGVDIFFVDPVNIGIEYGRSNFDIRQRFVSNFIWEIPYRRDQVGVLGQILGGWQVTGTLPIQTGLPFGAVHMASDGDFNRDGKGYDRPDEPSFGNSFSSLPSNSEFMEGIWEHSDFPVPEEGHNGTLGKNTYSGPHFWRLTWGCSRTS